MYENKFIPTDFTWGRLGKTLRLLGFWADSNVWNSSNPLNPLHGIKFSYINLKTGVVIEDVVHFGTLTNIREAIMTELVKVFPKPIPKREIGLTVEEIGEIIREYTEGLYYGEAHGEIYNILKSKNLIPQKQLKFKGNRQNVRES